MDHYQFIFEIADEDKRNMLIALLDNTGFEGFEEERDQLKAFIPIDKFHPEEFDEIIENNGVKYSRSIIKEINWNEKWEASFEPVLVYNPSSLSPFVCIRANFHSPAKAVLHDLVITPKMSFGTGHHATTYLMVEQMSLLDFREKTVIDFGTGTAVLAILAEKLGATGITGIDNDDWSISNAKENIAANNCKNVHIVKAETIGQGMKADIILANINLNIIITSLEAIRSACNYAAQILFSGIMVQDKEQILEVLKEYNFTIKGYFIKDNWLIILANG